MLIDVVVGRKYTKCTKSAVIRHKKLETSE